MFNPRRSWIVWRSKPEQALLTGWALELDHEVVDYQLEEARGRADALLAFISDQESKVVMLFGVTTLLVSASGVFGSLEFERTWSVLPDGLVVAMSIWAWIIALVSYRPQRHDLGLDPVELRDRFTKYPIDELKAYALESWVISYEANAKLMESRGSGLKRLMVAVVAQSAAIVLVEVLNQTASASGSPLVV